MRHQLSSLIGKIDTLETRVHVVKQRAKESVVQSAVEKKRETDGMTAANLDELFFLSKDQEEFFSALSTLLDSSETVITDMPLIKPIQRDAIITAGFGKQVDPFTGKVKFHYGVDFAAPRETPIIAPANGRVEKIETHSMWGRRITLRHGFGFKTVYAHLGTVSVRRGQRVKRGDKIATVGISGVTIGPHLHYEIWRSGEKVDPADYFFPEIDSLFAQNN
jgi:murein DD-endopeptidase MepM/ murein hydrolase activator NlpD